MLKMLPVCLIALFLTSCALTTPETSKPFIQPVILAPCLLNVEEVIKNTPEAPIKDFQGCDIITPYTARQILVINQQTF